MIRKILTLSVWVAILAVLVRSFATPNALAQQATAQTAAATAVAPQAPPTRITLTNLGPGKGETLTRMPAFAKVMGDNVQVKPFLTTSDMVGEFQFAGTPDGMGAWDNGDGTFSLLVNHEWQAPGNITDSMVSKLVVDKKTFAVKSGEYVIKGDAGYKSFCSATLVGKAEGFDEPYFLTNEEHDNGVVVAFNVKTNQVTKLEQLGRFLHENTTAIPYKGKVVLISSDDAAPGELYMLVADTAADVLAGKGQLYALKVDAMEGKWEDMAVLKKGEAMKATFVPINAAAAKDAKLLQAAAEKAGAFKFVRIEDTEHDRNDPLTLWFATTGRSQAQSPDTQKPYNAKGALYTLKLDASDPTKASLTLILSGDQGDDILNPDNLATSKNSVMITEDINGEFTGPRAGRIVRYDIKSGKITPVVQLTHKDFEGKDITGDKLGEWEASGIINAFDLLGDGTWIFNVQAHTFKIKQLGGTDEAGQLLILTVKDS